MKIKRNRLINLTQLFFALAFALIITSLFTPIAKAAPQSADDIKESVDKFYTYQNLRACYGSYAEPFGDGYNRDDYEIKDLTSGNSANAFDKDGNNLDCSLKNMQSMVKKLDSSSKLDLLSEVESKSFKKNGFLGGSTTRINTKDLAKILNDKIISKYSKYQFSKLNDNEKYEIFYKAFTKQCAKKGSKLSFNKTDADSGTDLWALKSASFDDDCKATNKNAYIAKSKDFSSKVVQTWASIAIPANPNIIRDLDAHQKSYSGVYSCDQLSQEVNKVMRSAQQNKCLAAKESGSTYNPEEDTASEDEEEEEDSCSSALFGFGWLICPGQNLATAIVGWFNSMIADLLEWNLLVDESSNIRDTWQSFLNIANIVFAIVFIVMIYSMATSTGLSNYDIKKLLPRSIVVAVLVNISFYICAAMVDISNIAGKGIHALLFDNANYDPLSTFGEVLSTVGGSIASLAAIAVIILFFAGPVVVSLIIIILAINIRSVALMILVIISPVAFAMYLLPNTQKWFKQWLDMFVKMLLVYPMFMAVWGGAKLTANIAANTGTAIPFITTTLCAIGPAMSIIPLFKMSGSILGKATSAMSSSSAARSAKRGISSFVGQSRPTNALRGAGSGLAMKAQDKFGNTPGLKHIVGSAAVSDAANWRASRAMELDKKAISGAASWVDYELNNDQKKQLAINGSYTDAKGSTVNVSDPYKRRAAMAAVSKDLGAEEISTMVKNTEAQAQQLELSGQGKAAQNLRDSAYSSATASGNAVMSDKSLSEFRSGGWTNRDSNGNISTASSAADLEAKHHAAVREYANSIDTKGKFANQSQEQIKAVNDTLSTSNADDHSAIMNYGQMGQQALADSKLTDKMSAGTKSSATQSAVNGVAVDAWKARQEYGAAKASGNQRAIDDAARHAMDVYSNSYVDATGQKQELHNIIDEYTRP
ncbi:MAG: hypothetical protein Q4C83_00120 [Candidatus Saccharibacteria bacterium]|nr:hypothetical protein [Candidatus Saccharibacteria bacterium]